MGKMKAYIGTKVILAEPMDRKSFCEYKGVGYSGDNSEGYLVKYSNPDGSFYESWSPKEVFERAYREVAEDEKEMIVNN